MKRHARALAFTATTALFAAEVEAAVPAHAYEINNGAIVFVRVAPGGAGGLVVTDPDGSGGTHVVHPTGNGLSPASQISAPAVSPDGSRVAFADHDTGAVWVAGIDGSAAVRISDPRPAGGVDSAPSWAPSGREVYFARLAGTTSQIYAAWADGRGDRALFSPTGTVDSQPSVAPNGDLAFVRIIGGTPTIVIWKFSGTPTPFAVGADPAWSADGARLAYTRSGALYVKTTDGQENLVGTSGVNASHPGWSADQRIVFQGTAPGASQRIWVIDPATLQERTVDPEPGAGVADLTPTWQQVRKTKVDRVGGADRVDTAVDASRLGYDTVGPGGVAVNGGRLAKAVVLSRSDTFADALAGSALAGHLGGPLLLTGTGSLDDRTAAEIRRVLPPGGAVYLLGDTGALSANVAGRVAALGYVELLRQPERAGAALTNSPRPVVIPSAGAGCHASSAGRCLAQHYATMPAQLRPLHYAVFTTPYLLGRIY